jgi:hypothetical protein
MLINLSNHPSANWSVSQLAEAAKYGQVVDLPFPVINPEADSSEIMHLAESFEVKVKQMLSNKNTELNAVHLMGELTFCFALVNRLQKVGITCLASTTSRLAVDFTDGTKTSRFDFIRFREYPDLTGNL